MLSINLEKKIDVLRSELNGKARSVEDRVHLIQEFLRVRQQSEKSFTIPTVLIDEDWSQDEVVTSQHFLRDIISVARGAFSKEWEQLINSCTQQQAQVLTAFADGAKLEGLYENFDFGSTRGMKQELAESESAKHLDRLQASDRQLSVTQRRTELELFEDADHKTKILVYVNAPFSNWGHNVKNKPILTFVPKSPYGIQQIVKYAAVGGYGVRVSGYRHSWSPVFARDKDCVLISTLDLYTANTLPNTASLAGVSRFFDPPKTELNQIKLLNSPYVPGDKAHGAGRQHRTLSDLVHQVDYVDAHGAFRSIQDKEELRAASGCFGLLGIITYLTLELDPMSYAVMKPVKVDVIDALPPPPSMPRHLIPGPLNKPRTDAQMEKAQADLENRATNHYYAEWLWFPYSDKIWINTWESTKDKTGVQEYPSKLQIVKQWIEAVAMELLQNFDVASLIPSTAVSRIAMASLPDNTTIKTGLPDALHFRRATQNTRVRNLELEIPLPPSRSDPARPSYTVVQQAWWDAILSAYKHQDQAPMRMPLEMRITSDSNVVMAPQRGNTLGTCSIEILTLHSCAKDWPPFAQEVLDKWMGLRNFEGQKLNIRPHWAKEWYNFRVDGKPFIDYLKKEAYKDEIQEFNDILQNIGKRQGWTRADLKKMFSNEMLDGLFFADIVKTYAPKVFSIHPRLCRPITIVCPKITGCLAGLGGR